MERGPPAFSTAPQAERWGLPASGLFLGATFPPFPLPRPRQVAEWPSQASPAGSGPMHSRCSGSGCRVDEGPESRSVTPPGWAGLLSTQGSSREASSKIELAPASPRPQDTSEPGAQGAGVKPPGSLRGCWRGSHLPSGPERRRRPALDASETRPSRGQAKLEPVPAAQQGSLWVGFCCPTSSSLWVWLRRPALQPRSLGQRCQCLLCPPTLAGLVPST